MQRRDESVEEQYGTEAPLVTGSGADPSYHGRPDRDSDPGTASVANRVDSDGLRPGAGRDALLPADQSASLRQRWREMQAGFVDDPRESVRQAGDLVGEAVQIVSARLTEHWQSIGPERGDAATEELRQALRRYRSLFDRVLDL